MLHDAVSIGTQSESRRGFRRLDSVHLMRSGVWRQYASMPKISHFSTIQFLQFWSLFVLDPATPIIFKRNNSDVLKALVFLTNWF